MVKTKKVAKPQVAQTLSKEMKQAVEGMIQKALQPFHKQLGALEQKLKVLKIDKGAPKKANVKKAVKASSKPKASAKTKSKKTKMKKVMMPQAA